MSATIRLAGWSWDPAFWLGACKLFGSPPSLLVLHCGAKRADVAAYVADPVDAPNADGAVLCKDGKWRRRVAPHFSWSPPLGTFVQQLGLEREGWGTGISEWRGVRANRIAIHIELPGPPEQGREGVQLGELVRLAAGLRVADPQLTCWTRHSCIDPERRDPGPGVPDDVFGGMLRYCPS